MSVFNTRYTLPDAYGQVITEPINSGAPSLTTVGIVGSANSGPMDTVLTFNDNQTLLSTLGECEAVDYIRAVWAQQAGTVKFVRVADTRSFNEIWMDDQTTGADAVDVTDELSREYSQALLYDTGGLDWVYVGKDTTFDTIDITFVGSGLTYGTASARTILLQYYNGTSWTPVSATSDTTIVASQTLETSGLISFVEPTDWEEVSAPVEGGGAGSYYWIRMRPNEGAATAGALVNLLVEAQNAMPAYGFIADDIPFTDSITTSNAAGVTLTDNAHTSMRATYLIFSGTADVATSTTVLADADATFISDGVKPGYFVRNTTEGATLTIVSVDSETQLTTEAVTNWSGDAYDVYKGYDFVDSLIQVGDVIENVSDGSTALVLSIGSANAITTTALSGGYNNGYFKNATVTNADAELIVSSTLTADTSTSGSYYLFTDAAGAFITNRVGVGDLVVQTTTSPDESATVAAVISETQLLVSGADAAGWVSTNAYKIYSKTVIKCAAGQFVTDGLRPGQLLTLGGGGTTTVVSVISDTLMICDGISGGTADPYFGVKLADGVATNIEIHVSYTKAADQYTVTVRDEKAYLEAREPGTGGQDIAVEIYTAGGTIHVLITNGLYEEEYTVSTSASGRLTSIISDINTTSELVTAESLASTNDMVGTMASTYLIGGSNGTATDQDYADGLELLLAEEDIGLVFVAADYTDAINAALKAHVGQAVGANYQLPRIAVCAKPESENFLRVGTSLRTEAANLSYDGRTIYVIQRGTISAISSGTGLLTNRTALVAAVAGRLASLPAAQPMTAKAINIVGVDKLFNRSDKITLIGYGIMVFDQDAAGVTCVKNISTTLNSVYSEVSVRRAVDTTEITIRETLGDMYIGRIAEPGILNQIKSTTQGLLSTLTNAPTALGAATLRDWRNVYVSFNSQDYTRIDVSYEVLPLTPLNVIFTSMFVHSGISFEI